MRPSRHHVLVLLSSLFLLLPGVLFGLTLQPAELSGLTGTWEMEIDAEGEYYTLILDLEETAGTLEGKVSEQTGSFMDVPLSEVQFDGSTLTFAFTAPTPPDGLERLIVAELQLSDGTLTGVLTVPDLGVSALATAKKK